MLLGSGCTSEGRPTDIPTSPTIWPPATLKDCGKAAYFGGPDGGVVAGMVYPAGDWALGVSAEAYLCLGSLPGSVVRVLQVPQSGSLLTVQPTRSTVPEVPGVLPVTLTATAPGRILLQLRIDTQTGKPQVLRTVALVVADSERWHFEEAH